MANLLQNIELKEQKDEKLQDYLFQEIKNQQKWRNNRSDALNDQLKFYESYFGKNSFIDKSIMERFLKESQEVHNDNINYQINNKTKFLELSALNCNNNSINQVLYSFDNDDKEFEAFNFSLRKNENNINENNDNNDDNEDFCGKFFPFFPFFFFYFI